ncbi:hypothetical protein BDC45DRAFT_541890 [Circinella umbellata]|nr:hypothetical protein BDC45DRAFT_541890 [Circinella umbellata]
MGEDRPCFRVSVEGSVPFHAETNESSKSSLNSVSNEITRDVEQLQVQAENDFDDFEYDFGDKGYHIGKENTTKNAETSGLTRTRFDKMVNIINNYIDGTHQPLYKYNQAKSLLVEKEYPIRPVIYDMCRNGCMMKTIIGTGDIIATAKLMPHKGHNSSCRLCTVKGISIMLQGLYFRPKRYPVPKRRSVDVFTKKKYKKNRYGVR